ncbi:Fe-S cluster assembly sulfur transfer protein SufU [Sphaerochaeta sp. PS]|uniref:Fe-S cluster assembly sulfur transfer protein SufU n=1 Tax=Sphaerochaeta sp. PS TaxID=3076336 RepID=UPI0028A5512B|nr:SUF system NifU family Fe-S cluster assembly protein [Sphaerochaeta sp. PS]MDT4763242.1 SUF system NifU family Fe-S cluster assembly protein [Sphaerochaeta sp. PS]
MEIDSLYTQVVLAHNSSKRNRRHLEHQSAVVQGVNPSCGDEISLELDISEDQVIRDVSFVGTGCAISQASASIMADLVRGKTVSEAKNLSDLFFQMIRGGAIDPSLLEATVFSSMASLPARVKCAALGWRTLEKALAEGESKSQ